MGSTLILASPWSNAYTESGVAAMQGFFGWIGTEGGCLILFVLVGFWGSTIDAWGFVR